MQNGKEERVAQYHSLRKILDLNPDDKPEKFRVTIDVMEYLTVEGKQSKYMAYGHVDMDEFDKSVKYMHGCWHLEKIFHGWMREKRVQPVHGRDYTTMVQCSSEVIDKSPVTIGIP